MSDSTFPSKSLRVLFAIHAVLTCAAAIVLVVVPSLIPAAVGINLSRDAYLLCYLLAASELSLAFLSWKSRKLTDVAALRIIVRTCLVLHLASAVLEIYAFTQGVSAKIWGNIIFRIPVIFLFAYYGLYRTPGDRRQA